MRESGTSNLRRSLACVMSAVMLVAAVLPAFYIAAEADHDCAGGDCPICVCLQQCDNVLNQLGAGVAAQVSAVAFAALIGVLILLSAQRVAQETLISKKVRLNI